MLIRELAREVADRRLAREGADEWLSRLFSSSSLAVGRFVLRPERVIEGGDGSLVWDDLPFFLVADFGGMLGF